MARKTTTTTERTRKAPVAASAGGAAKTTTALPVPHQQGGDFAVATSSTAFHSVSEAQIALRAYELFLARGATPGNEVADWLQAELELKHARA